MEKSLEFYKKQRRKIVAFNYLDFIVSWDMETDAAEQSIMADSEQVAVMSEMSYQLMTDPQFEQAVEILYNGRDALDEVLRHEIEVVYKNISDTKKIPQEEYVAYSELTSKAYPVYVKAKTENNFELFRPYLEKIVDFCRKQTKWLATEKLKGYDVLLDQYEPHYTQEKYDQFFGVLREKLVPFVKKVTANPVVVPQWAKQKFPSEKQREFCEYLRDVMRFDKSRGIMKVSEHPFTSGFGTDDVRITNHYYEDKFDSAIFSCIHETGHALYEQQCDKSLNNTLSGGGASLGLHESQSRFYENIIGRSRAFWKAHYGKLQQTFAPLLDNVSLDEFTAYINTTERSLVRTEADELTYPLHVMLRYEIEQKLISGELEVKDLPAYWNKKFYEYFGITPQSDTLGVLQDVHWAYGNFGYFPTYALGSAIASQLYFYMNKDFDVEASLKSGTTEQVNEWLKERVHKYGSSKYPDEILKLATGEDFNPDYYVEYLIEKYSK
ncbi:MAG: carboxypeptidase M32 [Corallococcus sp.]|nr:carboxypeptidase M32 [Bacillota bacterium]MCM1533080.1 carboxypeptidase M32 [Corallococcus sp.]